MVWRDITGEEPPPTPISSSLYTEYGFPWFDLYDEGKGDIAGSKTLGGVKTIKDIDKGKGFGTQQDDTTVDIAEGQVKTIKDETLVHDGTCGTAHRRANRRSATGGRAHGCDLESHLPRGR